MYITIGIILSVVVFFGLFTGLAIPKYREEMLELTPSNWLLYKITSDFSDILEDENEYTESLSEKIQIGLIITIGFIMWLFVIALISLITIVIYPVFIIGVLLLLLFNEKLSK